MDLPLTDPAARTAAVRRLATLYAGRPVVLGPGVLAGYTPMVAWLRGLGSRVLVLSTVRGAGDVPDPGDCVVVDLAVPATASLTEELRALDRLTHDLPDHAVSAIEEFDPAREAVWNTGPFVRNDEPILGRQVVGGRPAAWLALEDKLVAERVWAAADVETAPHRVVEVDRHALRAASAEVGGPLGAVWAGDARDGFNGGGDFVRWVLTDDEATAAFAFFAPRCDRVRVMPFLDGVPCSVHGIVLPDGTAVFRPVEIAMLRARGEHRFVYGGLSTYWDPPAADREQMRAAARRVGEHLRDAHGYRGAFGIDGVLTAEGFRPTELNTRMSAGLTTVATVDRDLFALAQAHLVAGLDTGLTAAALESLLDLMDRERFGRPIAVSHESSVPGPDEYPVAWDGTSLTRSDAETGNLLVVGNTATGFFAKIDPCSALRRGDRLAPLNAGLMAYLDQTYDAGFGPVEAAPDVS